MDTALVPGQTPHDESDRRTEPRSSVSDLVNSLTSEMLMVRGQRGGVGQWFVASTSDQWAESQAWCGDCLVLDA